MTKESDSLVSRHEKPQFPSYFSILRCKLEQTSSHGSGGQGGWDWGWPREIHENSKQTMAGNGKETQCGAIYSNQFPVW